MNKWIGKKTTRNRLRRMKSQYMREPLIAALVEAAERVRKEAQDSIRAGAISGPGHVPSPPGEPPNADTHNLDLSIDIVVSKTRKSVQVIARAHYAAAQEYGTYRLPARPFMRPALRKHRHRFVTGAVKTVKDHTVTVFKDSTKDIEAAVEFILSGGTREY